MNVEMNKPFPPVGTLTPDETHLFLNPINNTYITEAEYTSLKNIIVNLNKILPECQNDFFNKEAEERVQQWELGKKDHLLDSLAEKLSRIWKEEHA